MSQGAHGIPGYCSELACPRGPLEAALVQAETLLINHIALGRCTLIPSA